MSLTNLMEMQDHEARMSITQNKSPACIPLFLGGGIGDVIMNLGIVDAVKSFGNVEVYTRHVDTFNHFYKGKIKAKGIPMPAYTWFLDVCGLARFKTLPGFTGYSVGAEALRISQEHVFKQHPILEAYVKQHPYLDNSMGRWAKTLGLDRRMLPYYSLGLQYAAFPKIEREVPKKYITIHDGYEVSSQFIVKGRATKTWKWAHWCSLVKMIKKAFPDYTVVQLGSSTARIIDGVDFNLVNGTHIIEAFKIISQSALHIDGDSGLVHAATHMSVPCIVLFGATPDYLYGYEENYNLTSKASCEGSCWWLKKDWLGECPAGFKVPQCMDDITPEYVMEYVLNAGGPQALSSPGT